MDTITQHGYLVLADISGYTSYLAGVELEHAHGVLTDLLEVIVSRFKPLLTIVKLEGDAVFAYVPESRMPRGETLLELVEATYLAFRDKVEAVRRATTCQCNACRSIPALDLKFLAHHGDYIVQSVSGIHELVGSDVNLVHRLLKNHVGEATGWRAYALFTTHSLEHMCLKPDELCLHPQTESYEHLGEVQTYSLDLHARHKELIEARRVFLTPEEADVVITQDVPAPPPVVWEWLNDNGRRMQWATGTHWKALARPAGRSGVGARNHCAHGKGASVETILDWRPFDYVTNQTAEGNMLITETIRLEPLPDGSGTRIHDYMKVPMPLPRWLRRPLLKFMMFNMNKYDEKLANLARLVAEAQPSP